jgi:hypothetical protein
MCLAESRPGRQTRSGELQTWKATSQIGHLPGEPAGRERWWRAHTHLRRAPALHNDIGFIDLLQHWLDLFPMVRCVLGRLCLRTVSTNKVTPSHASSLRSSCPIAQRTMLKVPLTGAVDPTRRQWRALGAGALAPRKDAYLGQPDGNRGVLQKFRNKIWIFGFELNDPIQATM